MNLPAIAEDEEIPIGPGTLHFRKAGTALHPARESLDTLARQRLAMGSLDFAAQYQQAPVPAEGAMIKRSWLRYFAAAPTRDSNDVVVLSWDTAMKANERADYSVCTVWLNRGETSYLLDLYRERLDFPDLKRKALALHERWRPTATLVEDKGSGTALIQELRAARLPVIACETRGDKEMRMSAQSARFEAGAVLFPSDAPWLNDLLAELLAFPASRHDDQVDSISQALEWAQQYRWRPRPRVCRL
jgi:predicted phage terminase large subunit-like protein